MLYRSLRRFLLGLLFLTVIYGNVNSNELNEVGDTRKNIFKDIQHFFEGIFKPHPARTTPQAKKNITFEENTTSTGITIKYKAVLQPGYYVKRRIPDYMKNKKYGFQSDLKEDINKERGVREIDVTSKNKLRRMYFFLDWLSKLYTGTFEYYQNHKNLYRTFDDSRKDNYVGNKRRQNLKSLIILVTNQKKVHEELIAREGLSYLGYSESFTRDNFKQTILRQAYGDACIKVAIRKCYKALRLVNDMVCSTRFKCKSSFKSTFLLKAKTGCITGFDYTQIFSQKKETNEEKVILNKELKYNLLPDRGLTDEKREKYIDACIPYMLSERSNTVREEIHLGNNLSKLVTPTLRSDSDRKCQKFSREACVIACHYARDEVCSTYTCGRKKINSFTKECKNECKRSYSIRSDSSGSSKSNSDSD